MRTPPSFGHLFAGIDGFGLGLTAAGFETAWTVELDDHCDRVLAARLPGVERMRDVREVTGPPAVDGITAGFPCQDLSDAGLGAGIRGARSGLYRELIRVVTDTGPAVVLIENVPALRRRGLELVIRDLVDLGYRVEWDCIPAAALGAPHLRDRIWLVAHRAPAPAMFGEPLGLFPSPPEPGELWQRWPRAGWVDGDPGLVLELAPVAPTASHKAGALLPTPMAADGENMSEQGPRHYVKGTDNPTLLGFARTLEGTAKLPTRAAKLWPTPKASPSGPDYARAGRERSGGDDLATAVARQTPGQLNPAWVEWVMGFPLGWTDPAVASEDLVVHPWHDGEPAVPRVAENTPDRAVRLTALGNSLVPQIPAWLGPRLAALLDTSEERAA